MNVDAVGLVGGRLLRDLGAPAAAQLEAEGRRRLLERGLSLALPFKGQIHMRLKRTRPAYLLGLEFGSVRRLKIVRKPPVLSLLSNRTEP